MSQARKRHEEKIDFDTVLRRLLAKNDQLDRQLDGWLKKAGLTRRALELADELVKRYPAERVEQAVRQIERQMIDDSEKEWERITRPSIETLGRRHGLRLIRA
jgi:hypothetical protein